MRQTTRQWIKYTHTLKHLFQNIFRDLKENIKKMESKYGLNEKTDLKNLNREIETEKTQREILELKSVP